MTDPQPARPTHPNRLVPGVLRRIVLALIIFGIVGLLAELILLEHTESVWQLVPLVLLGVALPLSITVWSRPTRATLRLFGAVMLLCVIAGLVGLWLHFKGNIEWELESEPTMRGMTLVWNALTGAVPTLAPGALVQLGLLGIAVTFRHPAGARRGDAAVADDAAR